MQSKLAAYSLLSLLSFSFFSLLFHAVARADTLTNVPASPPQLMDGQIIPSATATPSPTVFLLADSSPTASTVADPTTTQSPTPTPSKTTPTATIDPTETPTPTPAQVISVSPTPTMTPTPTPTSPPAVPTSSYTIGGQIESAVAPTPTPTPTAIPTQAPPSSTDLESLFSKYSGSFSIDENELKKIARCESGFNTNSNNAGLYLGMFQFAASSWISTRTAMGLDPNPDLRTNAGESIKTAAFMLSHGQQNAWPNCK